MGPEFRNPESVDNLSSIVSHWKCNQSGIRILEIGFLLYSDADANKFIWNVMEPESGMSSEILKQFLTSDSSGIDLVLIRSIRIN